jgi:hypothetical protein
MITYTVQVMNPKAPRNKVYKTLTGAIRWADKVAGDGSYSVWRTKDNIPTLWVVSSLYRGERWHDFTDPATKRMLDRQDSI